ncbi:MAG: ABC transporter permease, partial [Chromatiales bacterium]
QGFAGSDYFDARYYPSLAEAEQALVRGDVDGIVHLRADFARDLLAGRQAPIELIVNGVDSNTARIIQGYAQGVWAAWLERRAAEQGRGFAAPVRLEQRVWFNAELRSRNYLVPGLIAVIMTLIGALLTAMIMAREWERGTMEALLVTPVSMAEIVLGKLIPYFILGTGGMILSTVMALYLFEVPLRGSLTVLFAAAALFLMVALGMGLLISILAKNQFVAGQAAIVATFLPAFMLSGFIFDINSLPWPIHVLTFAIAARYFVAILQTVFLAGNLWSVILPNALALLGMAVLFLGLIRRKARKRLE